jgi:hypothetical protein
MTLMGSEKQSKIDIYYINDLAYVGGSPSFETSAGLLLTGVHAQHVVVGYL